MARSAAIVHEAGDRAARLGLTELYQESERFADYLGPEEAKVFLSVCLGALMKRDVLREVASVTATEPLDVPLTVADVAHRLGMSRRVAYELLQGGRIPSFRVGRAIRVKPEDLAAFIDKQSGVGRPDPLACHRRSRKPRRL